jgi:hypothetical protein
MPARYMPHHKRIERHANSDSGRGSVATIQAWHPIPDHKRPIIDESCICMCLPGMHGVVDDDVSAARQRASDPVRQTRRPTGQRVGFRGLTDAPRETGLPAKEGCCNASVVHPALHNGWSKVADKPAGCPDASKTRVPAGHADGRCRHTGFVKFVERCSAAQTQHRNLKSVLLQSRAKADQEPFGAADSKAAADKLHPHECLGA